MNADRLLQHFEQISEAPDAVARLRAFVVKAAISGHFAGTLDASEWRPCTIAECATIWNGRAYKRQELLSQGTPIIRIQNLNQSDSWYYSDLNLGEEKYCNKGDLLYAWSGTFGPYIWKGGKCIYHYHIWKLNLKDHVDKRYFFYVLSGLTADIKAEAHGLMLPHMTKKRMEAWPLSLPALAEQHRIVAKVDELMALCSELEAAQTTREKRRDRLVAATLHRLNNGDAEPESEATFKRNAGFYFNHLPRLTTKPEHIEQLRQAILNLAVRGKLVEQDPEDEPAADILTRIAEARAQIQGNAERVKKGRLPMKAATQTPSGWEVVPFDDLLFELRTGPFGSSLHKKDYVVGGTPVVNPASIQNGRIVPIAKMAVGPKTLERLATFKLRRDDVVMARRGEMGRCAVVSDGEAGWLCGTGSLILRFTHDVFSDFIVKLMAAPVSREYLGGASVGATMQNLNQRILREMPVGVPPLAEQNRIVEKVDELMALCDELKNSIGRAANNRGLLLEPILELSHTTGAVPGAA